MRSSAALSLCARAHPKAAEEAKLRLPPRYCYCYSGRDARVTSTAPQPCRLTPESFFVYTGESSAKLPAYRQRIDD